MDRGNGFSIPAVFYSQIGTASLLLPKTGGIVWKTWGRKSLRELLPELHLEDPVQDFGLRWCVTRRRR